MANIVVASQLATNWTRQITLIDLSRPIYALKDTGLSVQIQQSHIIASHVRVPAYVSLDQEVEYQSQQIRPREPLILRRYKWVPMAKPSERLVFTCQSPAVSALAAQERPCWSLRVETKERRVNERVL